MLSLLQMFLVIGMYLFYYCYCKIKISTVFHITWHIDKKLTGSMLGYTTWSLIGSSANMLKNQGVNILINVFFGSVVNAANAIAYQVNHAVTNFTNNFTIAMNPQIIKTYAAEQHEDMKKLIFRGGKFSFYLLMFLCFPIIFETDYILSLWLGEIPEYTSIFTRLVLILAMIESFTYSIGCAIQATGNIKYYQLIISGVTLLNFPVSYLFYKLGFPPQTALSVSIVISSTTLLLRLFFMKKLLNISPREYCNRVFIKIITVVLLCLPIPILIYVYMKDSFMRLIVITLSIFIVNVIVVTVIGVDKRERLFLKNALLKILCK